MLPDIYGIENDRRARLRPMGVTLIAALWGGSGVLITLGGAGRLFVLLLALVSPPGAGGAASPISLVVGAALSALSMLFGLAALAISVGLLGLRAWARVACMVLTGLSGGMQLFVALLLSLARGPGAALPVLLASIVMFALVVYLRRMPVRSAFAGPRSDEKEAYGQQQARI